MTRHSFPLAFAVCVLAVLSEANPTATATVARDTEPMKVSSTGPSNTLPSFFFMAGGEEGGSLYGGFGYKGGRGNPSPFEMPVQNCPDEFYANESPDLRVPQLPWRLQDDWGCERVPGKEPVVVLENEYLRAAITPQWGSKIWSLYHKKEKRHLIYNNPAHQPSNIGYRKAWTSGGAEWNWAPGKIGHSVFTESPSFLAKINTERGPVVRAWEYDRQNHTVWSVDMFLDGDTLWAHPRIYNYNDHEVPGYWWTCVAMKTTDRTRIIAPAEMSVSPCSPWPHGAWDAPNVTFRGMDAFGSRGCTDTQTCAYQNDESYIGNIPHSHDFFMYVKPGVIPHITHVSEDGYTLVHSHPPHLRGTKFFQWGKDMSGQFMQDFMSASDYENEKCTAPYYDPWCEEYKHEGDYTELQVGPAPTQMHTFPVPGNSVYEWSEWFKGYQAETSRVHGGNYTDAVESVNEWMRSSAGLNQEKFKEIDDFLKSVGKMAPEKDNIMAKGMPWGGLREKLTGKRLVPNGVCPFPEPEYNEETRPWLDLLVNGTFSNETTHLTPVNFEVDEMWLRLLEDSMKKHKPTWLHHLFLGTYQLEAGDATRARTSFISSVSLFPSVHGHRNLAIFADTANDSVVHYKMAWAAWKQLRDDDPVKINLGKDLASEFAAWLMLNERWDDLSAFLADIPEKSYLKKDRVLHSRAALHIYNAEWKQAEEILANNCFPTYGSERSALIQLWWQAKILQAVEENGGKALTKLETIHLRRKLGCDGDSTGTNINSKCTRGPPNLGLQYGGF
jgi:hypothetical protein